jgi:glucose-1-phosphatase
VPAAKFRAVIFDIGRVLVRVDVARAMSGLGQSMGLAPEELWSAIEKDPHWPDWQEGRMTPRDWHLHLAKRLGGALTFEQFTEVWNRALDPKPIQEDAFLEGLSKRYRLALLSNTDPIHVAHMEANYDFMRHFPNRLYSCAVGASKPNPLIFQEALRACKVNPEEAVYIDDVPGYVEAARRLGMTGTVFQSPKQLQTDLKIAGVEID